MTTKFKSNLRNKLKIWKDDLNLICVSGGSNSMALLHMMYNSLFGESVSQRKMFFKVHVLYIDESIVYGWDDDTRKTNLDVIINSCE